MVGTDTITGCWIGLMSMLITDRTTIQNWFPTVCGANVGGLIGNSSNGYLGTQPI